MAEQRDGDQCPSDLLERPSAEKLNYWLSYFVVECRRVDGQPYLSSTLYQLLLRFSRSKSEGCPSDSVDVFQSREILKEKSDYGIVGSMFAGLNSCPSTFLLKPWLLTFNNLLILLSIWIPSKWILVYYYYILFSVNYHSYYKYNMKTTGQYINNRAIY